MNLKKIAELRPTQVTHGEREVRQKTEAYRALSPHDLEMAIAEKPIPIVLGPAAQSYAIDHHHVATALWHVGIKKVPVVLISDLSSLTRAEFWLTMENNRWTYPYDREGQRVAFADMYEHVWQLADDAYRSLSASVRDAGGYEKTAVPLEEFRWADFFRCRLALPETDAEFEALAKQAVKLAKSKAALGLPGYIGPAD